jgi:hypothetical protein
MVELVEVPIRASVERSFQSGRAKHCSVWHTLTSEITAMNRPLHFRNAMISGPFRFRGNHIPQALYAIAPA